MRTIGAEITTTPRWLLRPGLVDCGSTWKTVCAIYTELTGLELPETMPTRETRRIDAVLDAASEAPTRSGGSRWRILDIDETQTATGARTLRRYPPSAIVAFPIERWIEQSEKRDGVSGGRQHSCMRAVAGSVAAVAAATGLVYALRPIAPTLSLGVLYTLAVLAVAVFFGTAYAISVAVASMLAFNFLFLRPVHTLTLADARNWTALAVYLAVAVVASQLATQARRRAALAEQREREASFLADVAAEILQTGSVEDLPARAARVVDGADPVARARLQAALDTLLGMSRSDAIKTTILQAVSHDFRTPLATMAAAVGGLESGDLTLSEADRAELLETVRLELARLTRLVENLLDLSRIQAGAVAPRLELWSVDDLVSDLGRAERVRLDLPSDLPPVRVDAVQVQRVVANLVDNALKYSNGEVEVQARRHDGHVLLEVLDRGGGTAAAGMGLGLAIAHGFAAANGCDVIVEPRVGGGTRAVLAVPV